MAQSDAVAALLGVAGGARSLLQAAAAQLEPLLRTGTTGVVRLAAESGCYGDAAAGRPAAEPITLLVESRLPPARMLVFGANDFGAALVPAARLLGYHVTLCDARPAFARQERFAAAEEVVTDWPHRYLAAEAAAGRLDARTVVCVLTHDPKFDIPLLQTALRLDLAYVGAMGSRRSHAPAAGIAARRRGGAGGDGAAAFPDRAGPGRGHPGRGGRLHHRGAGGRPEPLRPRAVPETRERTDPPVPRPRTRPAPRKPDPGIDPAPHAGNRTPHHQEMPWT